MKLIAGLGNPGNRYKFTRHNMGFLVVDHLAASCEIDLGLKKFDALCGKGSIESTQVLLAEPQSFMNLSGFAIQRLIDYFKIEVKELVVVHDDLDLPFGTIRLKYGGGHGGHKGLMSIIQQTGSRDFTRVRMGIGKPAHKGMVDDYVLQVFSREEVADLPGIVEQAVGAIKELLSSGIQATMNQYHGKTIKNFIEEV